MSDKHPCDHEDCPRTWCYQSEESWDWKNAQQMQPKPSGDVLFQIRFNRLEAAAVTQAAKRHGLSAVEAIRRLAVAGNLTWVLNPTMPQADPAAVVWDKEVAT